MQKLFSCIGMGAHSSSCPPSRQVNTTYGPVIGRRIVHDGEKQVDAFQGIPFAKPPVGDLRFRKPEPPEPWKEVRECTHFGPRGMQKDAFFWVKWGKMGPVSEDCLYLNVFTPVWDPPPGGFPIMLFIHGGAFVSDSAVKYGDERVSQYLVSKGVVVVTAQYRLGYLGFWSTGDDSCPDNIGLWDQTAALRWVRDNGRAFDGDVMNVTLFGQSAGGASVDLLTISPHSRDMFHKVIPMAGNASCPWALHPDAVETCRSYAVKNLGIDDGGHTKEFLDRLREVDAEAFATSMKVDSSMADKMRTEIGPRLDGAFFAAPLEELRRDAVGKPRMVGCCEYEGLIMMMMDNKYTVNHLEELIAKNIPETVKDFKLHREELLKKLLKDGDDKEALKKAIGKVYSDGFLLLGTQKYVLDWLEAGEECPIYLYSFDYFNPKSWGTLIGGLLMPFKAATHCTELAYIFGVGIIHDFTFDDEDNEIMDRVTTMWSNFAKYGNPNGDPTINPGKKHSFTWLPATKEFPQRSLAINKEMKPSLEFHEGRPYELLKILEQKWD